MQGLVLILHILACLVLVVVVLLQQGKEGMGVIFGGGSQSVFGSSGAGGLLTKVTAGVAALFLVTSLSYNVLSKGQVSTRSTIMDAPAVEVPADEPEVPAIQIEESGDAEPAPATEEQGVQVEETAPESPESADATAAPAEEAAPEADAAPADDAAAGDEQKTE